MDHSVSVARGVVDYELKDSRERRALGIELGHLTAGPRLRFVLTDFGVVIMLAVLHRLAFLQRLDVLRPRHRNSSVCRMIMYAFLGCAQINSNGACQLASFPVFISKSNSQHSLNHYCAQQSADGNSVDVCKEQLPYTVTIKIVPRPDIYPPPHDDVLRLPLNSAQVVSQPRISYPGVASAKTHGGIEDSCSQGSTISETEALLSRDGHGRSGKIVALRSYPQRLGYGRLRWCGRHGTLVFRTLKSIRRMYGPSLMKCSRRVGPCT